MKKTWLALFVVLPICMTVSPLWSKSAADKPAVSAALEWLSLVDKGDYAQSWKEASSYFRGAITEENFGTSLEGVRKPLGGTVSRKLTKSQEANTLPGAPDGKYVVMQFNTSFEHKKSSIETVAFMLDKDGTWRAAGYYIK
jgi:hypothetical protein